ncbi:MAG: UDP-2,3-diacylglucosamine diphosphatase [Patescibacteria group bacterium]
MSKIDTIIVSDVHLGSKVSRAKELLNVLKNHSFDRLILLGDIFDDLNFSDLEKDHWELLSYIQELSNPKCDIEIIWVLGNHDELIFKVISHFIGIKVTQEYVWKYKNEKYLAIHGHQFDRFLADNKLISDIASSIYIILQRLNLNFSRFIKRASKKWLRLSGKIAQGAARHALKKGIHYVFCGHTHRETAEIINGVNYFNVGCWTDIPSVFITIGEDGIKIHKK